MKKLLIILALAYVSNTLASLDKLKDCLSCNVNMFVNKGSRGFCPDENSIDQDCFKKCKDFSGNVFNSNPDFINMLKGFSQDSSALGDKSVSEKYSPYPTSIKTDPVKLWMPTLCTGKFSKSTLDLSFYSLFNVDFSGSYLGNSVLANGCKNCNLSKAYLLKTDDLAFGSEYKKVKAVYNESSFGGTCIAGIIATDQQKKFLKDNGAIDNAKDYACTKWKIIEGDLTVKSVSIKDTGNKKTNQNTPGKSGSSKSTVSKVANSKNKKIATKHS